MKVKVTLDYWDGRTKEHIMYSDAIPYRQLVFKMMNKEKTDER